MKATKFIKKFQAMCDAHCDGEKCDGCPIGPDKQADVCGLLTMQPKALVKLVKNWAKGHRTQEKAQENKPEQGNEKGDFITLGELLPLISPDALVGLFQENPNLSRLAPIVGEDSSNSHWPVYDAEFDNSWQKGFYARKVSCIRPGEGFIDIVLDKEESDGRVD